MTNAPAGEYWHEHLSADEFCEFYDVRSSFGILKILYFLFFTFLDVLPILMTFTLIYMLMLLAIVMCAVELKSRHFLHATYKLFIVSVVFQELGVMSQCISYVRYALDGIGHPKLKHFGKMYLCVFILWIWPNLTFNLLSGQLCEAVSEICFLLLLLLLAKGYTVTRGRLRIGSSVKLTIFMCLYVVSFCCLFIYEKEVCGVLR